MAKLRTRFQTGPIFFYGLLLLLSVLFITSQPWFFPPAPQEVTSNIVRPDNTPFPSSTLSTDQFLLYAQSQQITRFSPTNGERQQLITPGYQYNRAVPPLLTPSGQLIYSGNGIWITDTAFANPQQLVQLAADRMLTSLVLSQDGNSLAWSSAPRVGNGTIEIFAGPLEQTTQIYQQENTQCPCFRAFAWQQGPVLLLTDDLGSTNQVQHGLWQLDPAHPTTPQPILANIPPQGPLALSTQTDDPFLFYTSTYGYVPMAEDGSVPTALMTQSYANDLTLAHLDSTSLTNAQDIIASQTMHEVQVTREPVRYQSTPVTTTYHWIMTPHFSKDASLAAYIQFTTDVEAPFTRRSQLYLLNLQQGNQTLTPQLQAIQSTGYVELAGWLNDHTLILWANNELQALDIQQGTLTTIASDQDYGQIILPSTH